MSGHKEDELRWMRRELRREDERRWIAAMKGRHARGLEYVCGLADVLAVIEERDEAWAELDRREREREALLETAQKALAHAERERDEALAEADKLRAGVDRLRAERRQLRARLVECLPWVGCTPYPYTAQFTEMIAARDLANDTLEEVPDVAQ